MTLNWNQTAADCRVSEYLAPLVQQHLVLTDDGRWGHRRDSDYHESWESPSRTLTRLLFDLRDHLPEGEFWDRARHRMGNTGTLYQVRAHLIRYIKARAAGKSCTCGDRCRFPTES